MPEVSPTNNPAIEFKNVSKRYGSHGWAVQGFSLQVTAGTTTCLVGPSGSGKTTLLRMVNRMVSPTTGEVFVNGKNVAEVNPIQLRRSIGYVMQNSGLLPHRKVIDNIATVPILNGTKRNQARKEALKLMDMVNLDRSLATRYPNQLSGGQQQRVGVARALASGANILLMDEPFGAVDPVVRAGLLRDLTKLKTQFNKTILFITHDISEAFTIGDQIVVIRAGNQVAQVGTPTEIMTQPADDFVKEFTGLNSGRSKLRIAGKLVIDGTGRPVGVLGADSPGPTTVRPDKSDSSNPKLKDSTNDMD